MPGTKIINVLRDDDFENILELFNNASADEVIFVLPKRHLALSEEDHFALLSEASQEQGRGVLILTSNPDINELALQYNFGVLTNEKREPRLVKKNLQPVPEEIERVEEEGGSDPIDQEPEMSEEVSEEKAEEGLPASF